MCILEGAQFVVSPALNLQTIEMCHRYSIAVLPGALTPTEIVTAWQAGADVVKVFPASAMGGAKYLTALKGPLPQVEMIPTGGVSLATAKEFLEAGAFALGVGSDLVNAKAMAEGKPEVVTESARKYLAIVREFRESKQTKNKFQKSSEIFRAENVVVKAPRFTSIHHKFTTIYHHVAPQKSQNPLQNRLSPPTKKSQHSRPRPCNPKSG